jgi:branched-chain amino acid transport system permease protein
VLAFALSGFIAGCAGALYGGMSGAVQGTSFDPIHSLVVLLFAYVGGVTSVLGALFAGLLFALLEYTQTNVKEAGGVVFMAVGAAAVGLGRQPNGIAGVVLDIANGLRRPAPAGARPAAASPPPIEPAATLAATAATPTGAEA